MVFQLLMRAASGTVCLNHFYSKVYEGCLTHNKNNSDKTAHDLQMSSALVRSCKTRVEHHILLFKLLYTIKEIFFWFLGVF